MQGGWEQIREEEYDKKINEGEKPLRDYSPLNYSRGYRGRVTVLEAIAESLNVPAVREAINCSEGILLLLRILSGIRRLSASVISTSKCIPVAHCTKPDHLLYLHVFRFSGQGVQSRWVGECGRVCEESRNTFPLAAHSSATTR